MSTTTDKVEPNDIMDYFNERGGNTLHELSITPAGRYAFQQRTNLMKHLNGSFWYSAIIFLLILATACSTPILKNGGTVLGTPAIILKFPKQLYLHIDMNVTMTSSGSEESVEQRNNQLVVANPSEILLSRTLTQALNISKSTVAHDDDDDDDHEKLSANTYPSSAPKDEENYHVLQSSRSDDLVTESTVSSSPYDFRNSSAMSLPENDCTSGCKQLGEDTIVSSCPRDSYLNKFGKCTELANHILYADKNHFKIRKIDAESEDVVKPIEYSIKSLEIKATIDFDIGFNDDEIFFSDDRSIYRLRISDGKQDEIFSVSDRFKIIDTATCREKRVIYFFRILLGSGDQSLLAIGKNESGLFEKVVVNIPNVGIITERILYNKVYGFSSHSIVVHQHIFYLQQDPEVEKPIKWSSLSGNATGDYPFISPFIKGDRRPFVLAIDRNNTALYWVRNILASALVINYGQELGEPIDEFTVEMNLNSISNVYVHGEWLYVCDHTNIWRFNKYNGSGAKKIISTPGIWKKLQGMRVFGSDAWFTKFAGDYWK